jgi:hypothetical protein
MHHLHNVGVFVVFAILALVLIVSTAGDRR